MILVEGSFRFPPENIAAAQDEMVRVVAASRAEAGCLEYAYGADPCDPGRFIVLEKWESRAALDAHFASVHMAHWQSARAELGFHDRVIHAHASDGGEPL